MASSIDATKPVAGSATTLSVRDNFSAAKTEIEALQTDKADLASPALTGTATAVNLTVSGTLNAAGALQVSGVAVTATAAELNYMVGVTENVQTQLDAKAPIAGPTFTGTVTIPTADINGGNIDGTAVGSSSESTGRFSSLSVGTAPGIFAPFHVDAAGASTVARFESSASTASLISFAGTSTTTTPSVGANGNDFRIDVGGEVVMEVDESSNNNTIFHNRTYFDVDGAAGNQTYITCTADTATLMGWTADNAYLQYNATNETWDFRINGAVVTRATSTGLAVGATTPTAGLDVATGDSIRLRTGQTPASSAAAGSAGEITWDDNYLYVRTSSGWRRVALGAAF